MRSLRLVGKEASTHIRLCTTKSCAFDVLFSFCVYVLLVSFSAAKTTLYIWNMHLYISLAELFYIPAMMKKYKYNVLK